ncbi:MAG: hypothetical protein H0X29_08700 [Parachlamydiaceae bacterium]|nr:hypothetical protein [Parachlamydiaceae bacterium]
MFYYMPIIGTQRSIIFKIMKVTMLLTKKQLEAESQYRNAAFNIFVHNRNDHAKKISFLMDENSARRLLRKLKV